MWLSPPIHCTSSAVNPSNSLQETSGSGPLNHSSARPLTRIAKLRQLIDRKSTRLNSSHTVIYTLSLHDALPIFRGEPVEQLAGDLRQRSAEPFVREAAYPDRKIAAADRHGGDHAGSGDVAGRVGHGLGRGHGQAQERVVAGGEEPQRGQRPLL